MIQQKIVNDVGLKSLRLLASKSSHLFLDSNPDKLERRLEESASPDSPWREQGIDVLADLSELNDIELSGPTTDASFVPLVRNALGHIPASEGLNEYLWSTINCFLLSRYVPIRWQSSNSSDPTKFVQSHWLDGGVTRARQNNAIARLWWLGEFAKRAAQYSEVLNEDDLLNGMANNVNLYHQLLYRPNLISRPKLVAALYEVFLNGADNDYLGATRYANELLLTLNLRAASLSLDFMGMDELREVILECKPPKER